MPRDGSLTPRDLVDKGLHVLRVECSKCGRAGRYRVTTLLMKRTAGMEGADADDGKDDDGDDDAEAA